MNKKSKILSIIMIVLLVTSVFVVYLVLISENEKIVSEPIRVACVGDSITQSGYPYDLWQMLGRNAPFIIGNYTEHPDAFSDVSAGKARYMIGNFGVGGTTVTLSSETPYMNTSAYQDALSFQPDIVIIMLGTNDAQPNLHMYNTSFVDDYTKLIASFQELGSNPKIWIALPPPIFEDQGGKMCPEYFQLTIIPMIEQMAYNANLPIIDVYSVLAGYPDYFPDGVHPNNDGINLIANIMYNAITS